MTKYTKMGGGGGFNHHHNYAPYLQPFSYKGAKRINGSFLFIIIVQGNGLQEIFGVLPRGRSASRWMGAAIPYWCFTTQTSQKAGSAFDFHTKSWFRVSSKPLPLSPPDPARRLVTHKSITSDTANPRYVGRTNPEYTVAGKLLYRISVVVRESIFNKIWDF